MNSGVQSNNVNHVSYERKEFNKREFNMFQQLTEEMEGEQSRLINHRVSQLTTTIIKYECPQEIKQKLSFLLSQKQYNLIILNRILVFFLAIMIGFIFHFYKQLQDHKLKTSSQLQQLQTQLSAYQQTNLYLSSKMKNMEQENERLKERMQSLRIQTISLLIAETKRTERDYNILLRYSTKLKFTLQQSSTMIKDNFLIKKIQEDNIAALQIQKKNSQNNKILISIDHFPQQQIQSFSVKIKKFQSTKMKMISIGIMSQIKKNEFTKDNCVYCQSQNMLYIYSKDGAVYYGQNFLKYYKSVQTKVKELNQLNVITIFVDYQKYKISWCIDSVFVTQLDFPENLKNQKLYAFVDMPNAKDKIIIYPNEKSFQM